MKKVLTTILLASAILIHLFFYISSFKTHTLDKYFLPVTQGQDFFQIPNGAKSFLNGGSLVGYKHPFTSCCGVNDNVYHPLFTIILGTPLQLLNPYDSFNLWLLIHFLSDVMVIYIFYKNFRNHKLFFLGVILFLLNNFLYYEILNNQFHFLLNLTTLFLIIRVYKKNDDFYAGLLFFATLLIKPIGIFWVIPLILGKYLKTVIIGLSLFILVTVPFYFFNFSKYYFDNLSFNILKANYADWNIFFIPSYLGWNTYSVSSIKYILGGLLIIFSIINRKKPYLSISIWILYVLIIYQNNFPYHYSILAFIVPLLILVGDLKLNWLTYVSLLSITIPAPFFIPLVQKLNYFSSDTLMFNKFIFLFWTNLGNLALLLSIMFNKLLIGTKETQ